MRPWGSVIKVALTKVKSCGLNEEAEGGILREVVDLVCGQKSANLLAGFL